MSFDTNNAQNTFIVASLCRFDGGFERFFFGEGVRYFRGVCMVQKEHLCLFGTRRSFFFFSPCLLKMLHCVSDILSCPVRYHGKLAASCGFQAFQSASHISCQARADVFYG